MNPTQRGTGTERGIDFDQVAAAEQAAATKRESQRPIVIDIDGPDVLAAVQAAQIESARTVLGDRALAEQKRDEVKRDLPPTIAVDAVSPTSPQPENRFHGPKEIAAFAKAQGVKVTPPGTPKGFWTNVWNAPRDAWRMLQGQPPEYSQAKREPIPDSTPIATFEALPTDMAVTADPNETTFHRVDRKPAQPRVEMVATPEQQEYARLNALRETLVDQGLLDHDGEPTADLRLYPEKYGVGPGDQEKLSQMQRDRFLTEDRTVAG